jgi:hypothetical protein
VAATINMDELTPDQRRDLGIRKPRETRFTMDELRGWSLKVLALMSSLSRQDRDRVLKHAAKVNRI